MQRQESGQTAEILRHCPKFVGRKGPVSRGGRLFSSLERAKFNSSLDDVYLRVSFLWNRNCFLEKYIFRPLYSSSRLSIDDQDYLI